MKSGKEHNTDRALVFASTGVFSLPLSRVLYTLPAIFLLFSFSCSSAPKNQEPVRDTTKAASEYAVFGNNFYRQGKYIQAEEMYLYALEYYKRIDNRSGMVSAYNSLGKTYLAADRPSGAAEVFDAALRLVESLEMEGTVGHKDLALLKAETYNNLGEIALRRGKLNEALARFNSGIELVSGLKNPEKLPILLHNRGGVFREEGNFTRARKDFERSLELNREKKAYQEMASNFYMLSSIASQEENFSEARSYCLSALEYDKKVENSVGIAQDLVALGHISRKQNRQEESADYYIRAYRIYESLDLENGLEKVVGYLRGVGGESLIEQENPGFRVHIDDTVPLPAPPSPSEPTENTENDEQKF